MVEQETAYQLPIEPIEGWSWGMKNHVRRSALYKNSQFEIDNENRTKRPNKNIVLPLLNIQYRLEGFDVKDIEIYTTNPDSYHKSFLIKKYHEKWAREQGIDTFIDKIVESYVDYGGVLVKNGKELEVVDLQTVAFCDQTDILSGAFAIKHYFNPEQLREMTAWDSDAIDKAILQAEYAKEQDKENIQSKTPSKYIEVYEVHGVFPNDILYSDQEGYEPSKDYSPQIHIISFYQDSTGRKNGITFFKKREPILPFKFLARDGGIFGRALGRGGVEELFEPQIWTNYAERRIAMLLDSASKVLFKTTDPQFKNKNKLNDLEDNSVLTLQEGRDIQQVDTTPRSLQLFQQYIDTRQDNASRIAAAGDILEGKSPSSGTPFKSLELQTIESKGMHFYRQGQIATFMDEIYRDWVLPKLSKGITTEKTFLTILSADEVQEIAERLVTNKVNDRIKEIILSNVLVKKQDMEILRQELTVVFLKQGRKRFGKILEGEMKGEELDVFTNIAGKQKDLSLLTDKLVNLVRQFIATPQLRQDPELVKMLNNIMESSGISPIMFSPAPMAPAMAPAAAPGGNTEPLQALAQANAQ